jgi:hypothetical protein
MVARTRMSQKDQICPGAQGRDAPLPGWAGTALVAMVRAGQAGGGPGGIVGPGVVTACEATVVSGGSSPALPPGL